MVDDVTRGAQTCFIVLATAIVALTGCSEFVDKGETGDELDSVTPGDLVPETPAPTDADVPPDVPPPDDTQTDTTDDAETSLPDDGPNDLDDDTPACTDACPLSDKRCVDAQTVQSCVPGPDGCTIWSNDTACPSPNLCQGPITCVEQGSFASCEEDTSQAVTCPAGTPCLFEVCEPSTGLCAESALGVGESCDDGNPCTDTSTCDANLECIGASSAQLCPCAGDDDCVDLDDGDKCNGVFECNGDGACELQAPVAGTCPDNPDPCLDNVCEPSSGACVPVPGTDGVPCTDNGDNLCVLTATCASGVCTPDTFNECADSTPGVCEAAVCAPETGICSVEPLTPCCGNGLQEGEEQCDDGQAGANLSCSASCQLPQCDSRSAAFNGTACMALNDAGLIPDILSFTVDFWIRLGSNNPSVATIAAMRPEAGGVGWALNVDGSGALYMDLNADDGSVYKANGPSLTLDTWQHVRVARSGSETGFWIDGAAGAVDKAPAALSGNVAGTPFTIGCISDTQSQRLIGDVDDLWIRSGVTGALETNFEAPTAPPTSDANTRLLTHFDHTILGVSPAQEGLPLLWQKFAATTSDDPFGADIDAGICAIYCGDAALSLNGGQSVEPALADVVPLETATELTVEFWYRNTSFEAGTLMAYRAGGTTPGGWSIQQFQDSNNVQLAWLEETDVGSTQWDSPIIPNSDQWNHIAITRQVAPSGTQAVVRYFINGTAAFPATKNTGNFPQGGQFHIGTLDGTLLPATFDIDDLRITTEAVYTEHFTAPTSNAKFRTNTVIMLGFNEGAGESIYNNVPSSTGPAKSTGTPEWLTPGGVPNPCP